MAERVTKTLRFDQQLIKQAELLARADNRSLNNWIETLILREVRLRKDEVENEIFAEQKEPVRGKSM